MTLLKNLTDKSVSKKLPDGEMITVEPGQEYDFPEMTCYISDVRLTKVVVEPVKPKFTERVKDFVEDLADDGKRNYSNDSTKKSPGRKKKLW